MASRLSCCFGFCMPVASGRQVFLIRYARRHHKKKRTTTKITIKNIPNSHSRAVRTQHGQRALKIARLQRPCVWPHNDIDRCLWMLSGETLCRACALVSREATTKNRTSPKNSTSKCALDNVFGVFIPYWTLRPVFGTPVEGMCVTSHSIGRILFDIAGIWSLSLAHVFDRSHTQQSKNGSFSGKNKRRF